jgi:predicted HNH restriction endonuclease
MAIKLNVRELRVRSILISVAKAKAITHTPGLISYKELWESISSKKWGRSRKDEIVPMIVRISAHELEHGRVPLNELVVRKRTNEPGYSWTGIQNDLRQDFGLPTTYHSHFEAQEACWKYWQRQSVADKTKRTKSSHDEEDEEAEEGFRQDRTIKFRKRNAKMILARKRKDKHTCQACGFHLRIRGRFIVDCHHRNPLGHTDDVRVVRIGDLVCLCPTCHRIAHTDSYPLDPGEIRKLRQSNSRRAG